MGKVMRHTLGASLNIRHNLSSSKGPKPLQLKLLTTYIPKTSAFTLRSEERFSRNAETELVCRLLLEKKKADGPLPGTGGAANGWRPRRRTPHATEAGGAGRTGETSELPQPG